MKIVVLCPQAEFTQAQVERLSDLGEVVFTPSREEISLQKLSKLCQDCTILAFDPDNIGGFEVSSMRLLKLIKTIPNLQGLALGTTAYDYVDLDYCGLHNITVTHVPHYSAESVAEHVLGFLLGAAKRIITTDRQTQLGQYQLQQGFELRGKTLGIVGLGSIGSRVAELGIAVGMNVVAYNRTPRKQKGVQMMKVEQLLKESDAVSLHLANNAETFQFLNQDRIDLLKPGAIVVNTADRGLVDEVAMAQGLKTGKVDTYVLEAEDITSPPLGGLDNAILFKGFGWYTREALVRNKEIWVNTIQGIILGKPVNEVG